MVLGGSVASAYERQWRVGPDFGWVAASFPGGSVDGFGAGAHVTYGLTDAINLRAQGDLSVFDLPEASSAIVYGGVVGGEYVLDVLNWVPFVGAMAGPVALAIQDGETVMHLGVEIPFGLGYQLSEQWTVGAEGRYRMYLLGSEAVSPSEHMAALLRIEHVWSL